MLRSELIDYFEGIKDFKRLCRAFKTRNKFYLYDVGTGKIFEITESMYYIISDLIDGKEIKEVISTYDKVIDPILKELKDTIETQNILKAPVLESFVKPNVANIIGSERQ